MAVVWRLTKTKHLGSAWSGEGARIAGGRWNSPGIAVVYAAETLALAVLEVLVHLGTRTALPAYSAIRARLPDAAIEGLDPAALPADWRESPPPAAVQALGDAWVRRGRSLALAVPSVIVPTERNVVLNPRHPDFAQIAIGTPAPFPFDARLVRP
jgi:RES domain-containing protein